MIELVQFSENFVIYWPTPPCMFMDWSKPVSGHPSLMDGEIRDSYGPHFLLQQPTVDGGI